MGAKPARIRKFGAPYSLTIYGDPSPELIESVKASEMDVEPL